MSTATNRLNGQNTNGSRQPARPKAKPRRRKIKPESVLFWASAIAPWGLAILLLAVSMPHLASGFQTICHCGAMAGWLLAIAIDSAQVLAKLQLTVAKDYTISGSAKWTATGIIASTSVMSMALNVLAFLAGAEDTTGTVLAWVAGILLPVLILALSYTGSCFALAKRKPKSRAKTHRKKSK